MIADKKQKMTKTFLKERSIVFFINCMQLVRRDRKRLGQNLQVDVLVKMIIHIAHRSAPRPSQAFSSASTDRTSPTLSHGLQLLHTKQKLTCPF